MFSTISLAVRAGLSGLSAKALLYASMAPFQSLRRRHSLPVSIHSASVITFITRGLIFFVLFLNGYNFLALGLHALARLLEEFLYTIDGLAAELG